MAYVKIWIHAVWGTKNRQPVLSKERRNEMFLHIRENARQKEIYIDSLNGYVDHVHCLLALNADMSISKAIGLIKGESSFWVNKQKLFPQKFEWADEYYAASVSDSVVEKVRNYIDNQEEHHRTKTFSEEYSEFLRSNGLEVTAKANSFTASTAPAINGGVNEPSNV